MNPSQDFLSLELDQIPADAGLGSIESRTKLLDADKLLFCEVFLHFQESLGLSHGPYYTSLFQMRSVSGK
jgi:hypothetical protein